MEKLLNRVGKIGLKYENSPIFTNVAPGKGADGVGYNLAKKIDAADKRAIDKAVEALGFATVKKAIEDARINKEAAERDKIEAKTLKVSVRHLLKLREKAALILSSVKSDYSMGNLLTFFVYRTHRDKKAVEDAHGKLSRIVRYGDIQPIRMEYDDRKYYPSSCKWKANHFMDSFKITLRELEKFELVDGVWQTVDARGKTKALRPLKKGRTYSIFFG